MIIHGYDPHCEVYRIAKYMCIAHLKWSRNQGILKEKTNFGLVLMLVVFHMTGSKNGYFRCCNIMRHQVCNKSAEKQNSLALDPAQYRTEAFFKVAS